MKIKVLVVYIQLGIGSLNKKQIPFARWHIGNEELPIRTQAAVEHRSWAGTDTAASLVFMMLTLRNKWNRMIFGYREPQDLQMFYTR